MPGSSSCLGIHFPFLIAPTHPPRKKNQLPSTPHLRFFHSKPNPAQEGTFSSGLVVHGTGEVLRVCPLGTQPVLAVFLGHLKGKGKTDLHFWGFFLNWFCAVASQSTSGATRTAAVVSQMHIFSPSGLLSSSNHILLEREDGEGKGREREKKSWEFNFGPKSKRRAPAGRRYPRPPVFRNQP